MMTTILCCGLSSIQKTSHPDGMESLKLKRDTFSCEESYKNLNARVRFKKANLGQDGFCHFLFS